MARKTERASLGKRLIASMEEGVAALRSGAALPETFVATPPDPPAFDPARLLALRERAGMSQAGFARLLNISVKAVESWEQGVRQPNGAALRLLQLMETPSLLARMVPPGMERKGSKNTARKPVAAAGRGSTNKG